MYEVAKALQYIEDDLLIDALNTVGAGKKSPNNAKSVRWKSPAGGRGGVKTKVIAITSCILAFIIIVSLWAAVVLTGSQGIDKTRVGDEKIFSSFDTVGDIYPDGEMAERLSIFDNMLRGIDEEIGKDYYDVRLYYNEGTDWQDNENWYSLIFSGYTGVNYVHSEYGVIYQTVTLNCLFTGTLADWEISNCSTKISKKVTIGGTGVRLRYSSYGGIIYTRYAYFEKNGIVYNLRIYSAAIYQKEELSPTEEQLIEYLEILLAD